MGQDYLTLPSTRRTKNAYNMDEDITISYNNTYSDVLQ
jgi:hypothetical protein